MPEPERLTELLEASDLLRVEVRELSGKVEQLAASNETLSASDRRQRQGIVALSIGGALLALVLAIVVYALVQIDETNDRLDEQARYDVASCERGNASRAAQRKQWTDVRGLLIRVGGPETQRLANALVANANRNFPALDCSAVLRGEEPQPVVSKPPAPR